MKDEYCWLGEEGSKDMVWPKTKSINKDMEAWVVLQNHTVQRDNENEAGGKGGKWTQNVHITQ